jgi:hypothetical protein
MSWSVLTSGPYLDMLYECEYHHLPRIDHPLAPSDPGVIRSRPGLPHRTSTL